MTSAFMCVKVKLGEHSSQFRIKFKAKECPRLISMHVNVRLNLRKTTFILVYLQLYKSLTMYLMIEAVCSNHRSDKDIFQHSIFLFC